MFNDVSMGEDVDYFKELLRAMIPLKKHWGGLVSTKAFRDPEVPGLLRDSGCVYILIGFESLNNASLKFINKGFNKSNGEIMAWLNSDDLLHPGALNKVGEIFSTFDDVEWLMGLPSYFDENGIEDLDFFINQELTPRPLYFNQTMFKAWARWSKHRYYNAWPTQP